MADAFLLRGPERGGLHRISGEIAPSFSESAADAGSGANHCTACDVAQQ